MSTFSGLIEEFPGISVDRFEEANLSSSTVFFLTHCHTDHMEGLWKNPQKFFQHIASRNQLLYCSPLTKRLLTSKWDLGQLANRIEVVAEVNPIVVTYSNPQIGLSHKLFVTVTAIPAGHCLGSVMFLFEARKNNRDLTVLYTGDFRIHPNDFPKLKPLHLRINDKLVPKKFDNIYLDTTFYNENVVYLPSRQEALAKIVPIVEDWLKKDEKHIVLIEISAHYGAEHLFVELSRIIKKRIHVREFLEEGYKYIPELARYVTGDPYETCIHACGNKKKPNVLICRSSYTNPKHILTIIPSVQWWIKNEKDLTKSFTEFETDCRRFHVCYSCHASFGELTKFIEYFNPLKVYPCVCPKSISLEHMQAQMMESHVNHSEQEIESIKYNFFDDEATPKRLKRNIDNFSDEDF